MFFFQNNHENELPEPKDKEHWEALLRGQVLNATTQKFIYYVGMADQKAQAMIILNSILIPVVINWVGKPSSALRPRFRFLQR